MEVRLRDDVWIAEAETGTPYFFHCGGRNQSFAPAAAPQTAWDAYIFLIKLDIPTFCNMHMYCIHKGLGVLMQ